MNDICSMPWFNRFTKQARAEAKKHCTYCEGNGYILFGKTYIECYCRNPKYSPSSDAVLRNHW